MNSKIITLLIAFILSVSAGFAQTLQLETVPDAAPGPVTVNLDMSGFTTNIGSASINIAIDTELLTYTGGDMTFGGGTILVNTNDGELQLSWFNASGTNANGTFAVLEFDYAGALATDLIFNQSTVEIANVTGTNIPVSTFIDGSISPATPVGSFSLADIEVPSVGSAVVMPLTANAIAPATDFSEVTAFQLEITYDPSKLIYTGVTDNSLGVTINDNTNGIIILSWHDVTPADLTGNFLLGNFNFNYLGGGVANLDFNSGEVNTETGPNPVAVELVGGSVRVDAAGPTQGSLSLPEIYAPESILPITSTVIVPVMATDVSDPVSVINLNMTYDASKLTYVSYTVDQLSGWNVNVNQGNGTIAMQYINATAQTLNDGSLLSFNFDYTNGEAALAFAPGTAMQTSVDNFLNLDLVDGFVNSSMTISAEANDDNFGTVTGGGIYSYDDEVTLVATPETGYSFVNWTEDGIQVFTDATYIFDATTARDLVANFVVNDYELTLSASPLAGGTLTGAGTYAFGTSVTVEATAAAGYSFVNWTDSNGEVSTDATYTFNMPAEDLALTANFIVNDYELTLSASPLAGGTLTGAGTHVFGASVTVEATAAAGYNFINWTDSNGEVSTDAAYTFNMPAEDLALTANFVAIEYTLTLVSSPDGAGVLSGGGDYTAGTEVAITAIANPGYQFVNWTDGIGEVSAVADFNYTMPLAAATLTANFSPVYSISGKVKYANTTGGVRPINTNGTSTTEVILFESDGTTEITRKNADINGDYIFEGLAAGDYVVTALTNKPWGASGVNIVDYALTRAFVTSGNPVLQGIYWLAADVNSAGQVNIVDYALIRNRVTTSNSAGWSGPDWKFLKVTVSVSNQNIIDFNILGIVSGDVNANYIF